MILMKGVSDRLMHCMSDFSNSTHPIILLLGPTIDTANFQSVVLPSKWTTIRDIFDRAFDLICPYYLMRGLFSRIPGGSVKLDGTFEFLSKTRNDEFSLVETKCLHIVWGEHYDLGL
jgi:hypothetical protein